MPNDPPTDLRLERRPKLSERIFAAVRDQIVSGEIKPGDKLPTENQMTEMFGVSRTVVREAVATLAAEGLVEARQGAGVFVRERPQPIFSLDIGNKISHALNVIEVRMGLEIESAGLAAVRRNAAQDAAIQEAFFEFDRLLALGEATGRKDFEFHRAIAAATNNPFYVEVLDALGMRAIPCDIASPWGTDSVLDFAYQTSLQQEHHKVMTAISMREPDVARQAMRDHLAASQERYYRRLAEPRLDYQPARAVVTTPNR